MVNAIVINPFHSMAWSHILFHTDPTTLERLFCRDVCVLQGDTESDLDTDSDLDTISDVDQQSENTNTRQTGCWDGALDDGNDDVPLKLAVLALTFIGASVFGWVSPHPF